MKNYKKFRFLNIFNINIVLCVTIFCYLLLLLGNVFALEDLSNDQIITAQNNGLVSAVCYVIDMVTGNIMRSIFAVFVIGTGWMFLLGGIKDYKPILFLTIAVALILGGQNLANLISGNDFSCKKLYEIAEINKETINNAGDCYIAEIDTYIPGQQWYKCSSYNSGNCEELVNDDTFINGGDVIVLKNCQTGSFKDDESINLAYSCSKESGLFSLENSSLLEKGRCKEACTVSDLSKKITAFKAVNPSAKSNTYKILDNSGSFRQNKYFTQKSVIKLDCQNNYIEYDENDNINADGMTAVCESNAIFDIRGSCKPKCKLKNTMYFDQVASWQKYNETTETWGDTEDTEFYFNEKIRINICDENKGYFFPLRTDIEGKEIPVEDEEKAVLICGENGSWKKEENEKALACSKNCDIRKYKYYNSNKWNICSNITGACAEELTDNNFNFQSGDSLEIVDCPDDTYSIYNNKDIDKLKITCSNGKWVDNGGERCLKKCNVNTIKNFEFVARWVLCNRSDKCTGEDSIEIIESGYTVKQSACKSGYYINANDSTEFMCKDGNFVKKSGSSDEVCRLACPFEKLADFDQNSLIWNKVTVNGSNHENENIINLEKIEPLNDKASFGEYYAIKNCKDSDNLKVFGDSPFIAKCDEGGLWSVHRNKGYICFPKCNLASIEGVTEWEVYNDLTQSYKPINSEEKTGGIHNGVKARPKTCATGTSLNPSIGNGFYIWCKNGELVPSNNYTICYKDCSMEQLGLYTLTNVKEFVNITTDTVLDRTKGVLKHNDEIGINICEDGFNLQNRKAVFICKDGTLKMVENNDPVEVCKKINQ